MAHSTTCFFFMRISFFYMQTVIRRVDASEKSRIVIEMCFISFVLLPVNAQAGAKSRHLFFTFPHPRVS